MSADRVPNGDPRAELPELSGRLRPPPPALMPATLAGKLVPVADRLRGLKAKLGIRPYRVWFVHAYWTGKRRGDGKQVIAARRELLPVPRVRDFNAVRRNLRAMGITEEGDLVIDEISTKYAEDDLMGRTPDMVDPSIPRTALKSVEFWYEVQESRPTTPPPPIRRFSPPVATPHRQADGFQWTMVLTKQGVDRGRSGDNVDKLAE